MPNDHSQRALSPVETEPGVLVHPSADRQLATTHWLLSTLGEHGRDHAREEWDKNGVALLPLGTLFSAVRIPGHLVHTLAGTDSLEDVDAFLAHALDGGPVICNRNGARYYALVKASLPVTWYRAVDDWRASADVDCLGRGSFLGVPRSDAVGPTSGPWESYWSMPMTSPAVLCPPLSVARLIAAAQFQIGEAPEA